jgi:hypothetical protein
VAASRGTISPRLRQALYGLSQGRCYAPNCDEPMLVVEAGEPVFVGEVAHIVGALESGPRGDIEIENRDGFDNLLLLCGRHHKVIDDPRTMERYPVEVLRDWKVKQETPFDTAARAEIRRLQDLPDRLPDLIAEAFREVATDLEATVDRLKADGHLTQETARLLHATLTHTATSGPAVGDGAPGIKEAFEEAYDASGGASFLGLPSADAYEIGPGFVQHLRGGNCGHPAVICALKGRPAVVVPADLWNGISRIGDGAAGGGVHGAGFPVNPIDGDHPYVGPGVENVPTTGGTWSRGTMLREAKNHWRWVPELAFDPNSAGDAGIAFGSRPQLDLRLRLVAHMPTTGDDLRVTAAGRRLLTAALAKPEVAELLPVLASGRIDVPAGLGWHPRDDQFARNDSWGASYDCTINTADGGIAIRGTLQFLMPHLMLSTIAAVVDLEFDFDRCQPQPCLPNTPVAGRLSLTEVVGFFTTAWAIAFDVLPLALVLQPEFVMCGVAA